MRELRDTAAMARSSKQLRIPFLRAHREAAGISLKQMAAETGYTEGHLSSVETGRKRANNDIINTYAEVLGLSPARLHQPAGADDGPPGSPDELSELVSRMSERDRRVLTGIARQLLEDGED